MATESTEPATQESAAQPSKTLDMTQGVIWKQLMLFFLPIWCGVFFQQLYNTADTIIIGRFVGTGALAAVGDTAALIDLFIGFFVGLSGGATIVIAQFFGAHEHDLMGKSAHTAVILSFIIGAFFTVLGWVVTPWALTAMQTPADILDMSITYLRLFCLGMIPNAMYNMGTGILRAVGDSKRPVYFLAVACCVNIALDLVFVVGLKLGVAGVAIATVISQGVSAVLVLWSLSRPNRGYVRLSAAKLRLDGKLTVRILRIGIPAALQSSMYNVTNIFVQVGINSFSTVAVAAWTVYGKLDFIYWMTINSLGMSITTFSGQNFGAGKTERMHSGVKVALLMSLIVTAAYGSFIFIFGRQLFGIFTTDVDVIVLGLDMMKILVPSYVLYIAIEIFSGAIRGTGDAVIPMLITCVSVCVLRLAWLFLALPYWHSLTVLCMSYPITWGAGSVWFFLYYKFGHWRERQMNIRGK